MTLKIRSRSPTSDQPLILPQRYSDANLVTFQPMVLEITCSDIGNTFSGRHMVGGTVLYKHFLVLQTHILASILICEKSLSKVVYIVIRECF